MGFLEKYISESDYNNEISKDPGFKTDKIIVPNRDILLAECFDELIKVLNRRTW